MVLVVLCELDAVAGGELARDVGVNVDSAQSFWIVRNMLTIRSLYGKQVAFGIRRYDGGIGVFSHANLFASAHILQRVAGIVLRSPCSVGTSPFVSRHENRKTDVLFSECSTRLELCPHGLIDLSPGCVVRGDDQGLFG